MKLSNPTATQTRERVIIDVTLTGEENIARYIEAVAFAAARCGQDQIDYCLILQDADGH